MKNHEGIELDRIVFIGRTFGEYLAMFDLDESGLGKGPVLDCAAGPSSFTAEALARGYDAVACDILYDLPAEALADEGRRDVEEVFQKVDGVPRLYVWTYYTDRDHVTALRHESLKRFAADYPRGRGEGRYVHAALPRLPFADRMFSLVLSSHFLFLYGDRLDLGFHVASLKEMVRVASGEVRVFPLQGLDAKPYPHMDGLIVRLNAEGIETEIVEVPFEFQRGSNKLMKLLASNRPVSKKCTVTRSGLSTR